MKKLSFFNKIIFVINTLFAVALVLSFFLPNLAPKEFGILSILSLLVPTLLIGNLIFVIYWILAGFKKQMIQSFFVLIIIYFFMPTLYKFNNNDSNKTKDKESLSIMTYNVRKFNLYKWLGERNISAKIDSLITSQDVDIVAMQEFKEDENFKLKYPYYYHHRSYNYNRKTNFPSGLAIYSKYPIINKGSVDYRGVFSSIIYADIVKKNDTFRVYNFHLESLGVIPDKDYFGHKDSERLLKRLSASFKVQQKEIDTLNAHIGKNKYRSILVGDMNNTAYSWAYKNLKSNFQDSFLVAGNGFGKTYEFKKIPLRIDYIFVDDSIKVLEHKNYNSRYSDHYPISVTLQL